MNSFLLELRIPPFHGRVAQWVRAPLLNSQGPGFDSLLGRSFLSNRRGAVVRHTLASERLYAILTRRNAHNLTDPLAAGTTVGELIDEALQAEHAPLRVPTLY